MPQEKLNTLVIIVNPLGYHPKEGCYGLKLGLHLTNRRQVVEILYI